MYKIQKGVPVTKDGRSRRRLYPFPEMEIGDSFSCDASKRGAVANAAAQQREDGKVFITRIVVENGKKVCRVWRTK